MPKEDRHGTLARVALIFLVSAVLFAHNAEGNASAADSPPYAELPVAETTLVETMSNPEDMSDDVRDVIKFVQSLAPEAKAPPAGAADKKSAPSAKDLAALKKQVAAKRQKSQEDLKAKSALLKKKLAADKLKLKAAKASTSVKPATKPAAQTDDNVSAKLLSTITKLQKKLKDVVSQNKQDLAAKVKSVEDKWQQKLKDLDGKLLREQRREGRVVKKMTKDKKKTVQAKQDVKAMKGRKDVRKKQYHEAKDLIRKLTRVTKRMKSKYAKEKTLREKAVSSAMVLGTRIKKMSHFGKKAAKFAKAQAVKAASIKVKAAKDTAKLLAKHADFIAKAKTFQQRKNQIKQELAQMKADKLAAEAKTLHEKTERHKVHTQLLALSKNMTHIQRHTEKLKRKVLKHKNIAKKATTKVLELKEEAHKAVLALRKVNAIRMALTQAKAEVLHYKQENKLQRMELAQAAVEELKAANVTQLAARHAEAMEEHCLRQSSLERKIVKEAQLQVQKGHGDLHKVRQFAKNLVSQAKIQLVQEHSLRFQAEGDLAKKVTNVAQLQAALEKEHELRLKEEATSKELREDRDRLLAREQAESRMIAIQKEATEESKLALANLKKAAQRREAQLKKGFQAALVKQHTSLLAVKNDAAVVSARSAALQKAVQAEKQTLNADHVKEAQERDSWQKAMAAMNKERIARTIAKANAAGSSRHIAATAQQEVGAATSLASSQEAQVAELRAQLKDQAGKFAQASQDWAGMKVGLEQGAEHAQEGASRANAKLAAYMKRREEDSTSAVAVGSVNAAMGQAEKAAAAKAAAVEVMALLQGEKQAAAEEHFTEDVPPELAAVSALRVA